MSAQVDEVRELVRDRNDTLSRQVRAALGDEQLCRVEFDRPGDPYFRASPRRLCILDRGHSAPPFDGGWHDDGSVSFRSLGSPHDYHVCDYDGSQPDGECNITEDNGDG